MTIENVGDCDWTVLFIPEESGEAQKWTLRPGKTESALLVEGRYRVEQKLQSAGNGKSPQRRFEIKVEGGKKYRWRIANLLSSAAAELESSPEGVSDHE